MDRIVVLCLCACAIAAVSDGGLPRTKRQMPRSSNSPLTIAADTPAADGVHLPGSNSQCLVNGVSLNEGAVWSPQQCSLCRCVSGNARCRSAPCSDTESVIDAKRQEMGSASVKEIRKRMATPVKKQEPTIKVDMNGEKTTSVKENGVTGEGAGMVPTAKPQNVKKLLTEEDEDDEDEDDEDDEDEDDEDEDEDEEDDKENDAEAGSHPTKKTLNRSGFMESLPDGCLLSDSLIACGGVGMAHLPIITDLGVKTLYLADNKISKIPMRGLTGLPNLEWLDLSKNKLEDSSLSRDLFRNLTKLKRLNLDWNNLTSIPLLPPSLEELKISYNKIRSLKPQNFKGLSNLLTLELKGNHFHDGSFSPLTFRPLRNIIYLRLDDNKFRAIPSGLPPSLQELHLSQNQLDEVQDGILNKSVQLKVLDLSYNQIKEDRIAPGAWISLPKLEALDLSHNKLVHVPSFLPIALRQLSLHHNQIERIPDYVFGHLRPGLESLHLSHNQMTEEGVQKGSFLGLYHSLIELFLDHNRLRSIPRGLLKLKALQLLRLNHNVIRHIRLYSICDTRVTQDSSLVSVHLENNLIDRHLIPPTALSCIKASHSVFLQPQGHEDKQ